MTLTQEREKLLVRSIAAFVFVLLIFRLAQPFFAASSWMEYVQDDFYYYLKVGQNIAHGHGSTFNGIVPTNGYHPLWEMLVAALSVFSSSPHAILGFQAVMIFGATLATFLLSMRLFDLGNVRLLTALALSLWVTLYSLRIFIQGMEVTLTVPLILALIVCALDSSRWLAGFWHSFTFGLLAACTVLSRLDSIILVGLLGLCLLLQPGIRKSLGVAEFAGVGLGLLPVLFYILSNQILFQTWLPVSGMAKQLKQGSSPSLNPLRIMHLNSPGYLLVFLPIPLALLLLPWAAKHLTRLQQAVYGAVLIFPFIYFSILSLRSDWPSWGWYLYSLRTGVCVSFLIFCCVPAIRHFLQRNAVTYGLLTVFLLGWLTWKWPSQTPELYAASIDLGNFSNTHPGIYAMGDRSGSAGYLISSPLIQTEGLMMDRNYLNELRSGHPLRQVLADYHVRYYVGSSTTPVQGCFQAVEPSQAGPASPHLTDNLCEKPVATFVHDGRYTMVYDLAP